MFRVKRITPLWPLLWSGLASSVGLSFTAHANAQSTYSLSHWVRTHAAPTLAKTLAKHPKFTGETVRFGTLEGQRPRLANNQLTESIIQELTHHVLSAGRNNVAAGRDCNGFKMRRTSSVWISKRAHAATAYVCARWILKPTIW